MGVLLASWQHALCGFFNHVSVLTELIKRRVKERERVSRLISCRIELDFQVECVSARNRETRTRPFDVPHDLSLSPFVSISWPR